MQFVGLLAALTISPDSVAAFSRRSIAATDIDHDQIERRRSTATVALAEIRTEASRIWKLNADGLLPDVHLGRRLTEIDERASTYTEVLQEIDREAGRLSTQREAADDASRLVKEASRIWCAAEATEKAAAARALSRALKGLYVLEDGSLHVGQSGERSRFFSRPN